MINKSDSEYGKTIWAGVEKVSKSCPEWLRDKIKRQAQESAKKILEKEND